MDLNKVQLIGNVTQNIELKQTPTGQSVASFSVATNRSWLDNAGIKQEIAEFHNIVLWWKLAEIAHNYLSKGKKAYIEGRLQTKSREAQDGTKRYKTEIVGENLILLWGKSDWIPDDAGTSQKSPVTQKYRKPKEDEISIDDIPF